MYLFPLSSARRWPLGGAGNRVGPGAQKGYEGLDGARTEFSFVPLRIPPLSRPVCPGRGDEPERKSSQSPWRESGCMILIIVITVVRPGPFKVFLSLYLCTEGKGAKMEKGCGGRDKAPPPAGRWCAASFPSLLPAAPGLVSTVEACLPDYLASVCCHSTRPSPGVSQRGDPLAGVSKRVTFLLMGVPALLFTGWPVSESYLRFLTCYWKPRFAWLPLFRFWFSLPIRKSL